MKKYIVLSVNDNPDYLYYTPLTCWAWNQFGWEPIIMLRAETQGNDLVQMAVGGQINFHVLSQKHHGFRDDTVTQMSRLYAAGLMDGYLMTGDIDMIPLSDYWQPQETALTVYGHDLTGYGHYPICYIGMSSENWRDVMGIVRSRKWNDFILRDLVELPQARSTDFYKYWFTDQDLITQKLEPYKDKIVSILRGQYSNGFAVGRVDRGAWSLNHSQFIDCHMFQQLYHKNNQDKFDKTMELLTSIWPDEDFGWFLKYTDEFRRLTGHA